MKKRDNDCFLMQKKEKKFKKKSTKIIILNEMFGKINNLLLKILKSE